MCRYHGEVWNIKTGGKCRAHAQRCSCSLWGLLYNLFFYFEYQLFNPDKTESVPGYFSAPSLYRCLCLVRVIPQETSGLALTTCECGSSPGPAYATGRLEWFPPLGKEPLTSICTALLAGLQDTVLCEPWRTLPSCLGSLKDSSWPWKSQEWGMPRDAGYSVSSGVCRCFCTTKPALMQCYCQVSCCRVSAITCCFLLLIFVSPNHYTLLYLFSHLLFCF